MTPTLQIAFDAADPHALARFWAAALGYEVEDHTAVVDGLLAAGHLGEADVHRRLGCDDRARHHLTRARDRVGALPDDGYGAMIRAGIDRCGERLDLGDRT